LPGQSGACDRLALNLTATRLPALLLALLLCALPAAAAAHQSSVVYSDINVAGATVDYEVQIASRDLVEALAVAEVTRDLLARRQAQLYEYVARRIAVENNGAACPPEPAGFTVTDKTDGFFADLKLRFACARQVERLAIQYDLFFELDPRHQGFARLDLGDGVLHEFVFRREQRRWDLSREVTLWDHAREYLGLGVEHIFTGYDHILFLCGLLVIAGVRSEERRGFAAALRYTLGVVTAFTVAHSATLIAAALGLVAVPTRISESGIALSIAYVGAENLWRREPKRRWLLTFGFGLIHGFGFATVLREVGLPQRGLILSLLSFNLGVELGQLAIVALLLPLLCTVASRSAPTYDRYVLRMGSAAIVGLGLFWLCERAFSVRLLRGLLG
jgi:hypothetical protein